jgi:hypothetical protein
MFCDMTDQIVEFNIMTLLLGDILASLWSQGTQEYLLIQPIDRRRRKFAVS